MAISHGTKHAPKEGVVFTPQQVTNLRGVFPSKNITPDMTLAEIQFQAGIDAVLRYIGMNTQTVRYVEVG